ncbi:SGNH/GDSL hydrolase family protein [uncultured Friedmanniella sp.]|uniref:SGNH/GDSL hydrolase family protein n=1 Tax=uncultured Friedmanniella sp. TaxID=335381 RepID=UPI0035CB972B
MPNARSVRSLLLCAVAALPLLASAAPQTAVAAPTPPARAVALGDSFAAGEGLGPYLPGSDTTTDQCHRSDRAYPALLESSGVRRWRDVRSVACSGATTATLLAGSAAEPSQLRALSGRTQTVTLTIGGNDVGFAAVLRDCVYAPPPAPAGLVPGAPGCSSRDDRAVTLATARLNGQAMPQLLRRIHRRAPQARIYVTGYPRLFGLSFPGPAGCPVASLPLGGQQVPLFVTAADANWIRAKSDRLNAALESSVARARHQGVRARYVDVAGAFTGHNVCSTGTPWVNGLVVNPTNPPSVATASFHPNALGQQAYADAVAGAARPRT